MTKQFLFLLSVLLSGIATMWAQTEPTYSPVLDVNFRTVADNTGWNSGYPKSAADNGNTDLYPDWLLTWILNLTNWAFRLCSDLNS
jgi:hypothetical protein